MQMQQLPIPTHNYGLKMNVYRTVLELRKDSLKTLIICHYVSHKTNVQNTDNCIIFKFENRSIQFLYQSFAMLYTNIIIL